MDELDEYEEDEIPSEAADQLMPLPDNWPHISQLNEKQSWDYSTATSPSVNKATSHLELLQTIIEEWFQEAQQQDRLTRSSSVKSRAHHDTPSYSRKAMRFGKQSAAGSDVHYKQIHDSSASTSDATALMVLGMGGDMEAGGRRTTTLKEPPVDEEVAYLGAEEVIEEVITLLAKLESDRTDTLQAMKTERERVTMLKTKIDTYSQKRMTDLPLAVQSEHEACAMDINELHWHVSYKGRIEKRNMSRVSVAETLNSKLKEDIAFVTKHVPLVMEKLDLEVDAMERIKLAQQDTNEELDTTLQRFRKVEAKSTEAHNKAEEERAAIKQDLDTVKEDLAKVSQELSEAKMTFNTYVHQCNDNRQTLEDNKQELQVLLVKDENTKAAEAMQAAKVKDLESEIKRKEFEHRTLEEANIKMQSRIDHNNKKFARKEQEMRDNIKSKEEVLRQLNRDNDELYMDNEDLGNKVSDCDRQKIADEKNLVRMDKELARTEEQISMTKDDLANVSIINSAVRDQLQNEEEKCLQSEEALRATTEALKKQVKEEIHTRTVLIARIQSDGNELEKTQVEVKQKKALIDKKVAEVNEAVQTILSKVEKLRTFHREKTEVLQKMDKELKQVAAIKREVTDVCTKKKEDLMPKHKNFTEKLCNEEKKLDHMEWSSDMMTKKIKEIDESSVMMLKAIDKTTSVIATLEADLEELNIQIQTGESMKDGLQINLTQISDRIGDTEKAHKGHMHDRNKTLDQHEKDLQVNLELNKALASQYRRLQNEHLLVKNKMLDQYDERVKLENAIKDLKQLQGLQKRMHSALLEYLKYRGLYNTGELQVMQEQSHSNGAKVEKLQGDMDKALNKITHFITHQLDGETIRKNARKKVEDEEKAEHGKLPPLAPTIAVS